MFCLSVVCTHPNLWYSPTSYDGIKVKSFPLWSRYTTSVCWHGIIQKSCHAPNEHHHYCSGFTMYKLSQYFDTSTPPDKSTNLIIFRISILRQNNIEMSTVLFTYSTVIAAFSRFAALRSYFTCPSDTTLPPSCLEYIICNLQVRYDLAWDWQSAPSIHKCSWAPVIWFERPPTGA